jgi:hypothetical protein
MSGIKNLEKYIIYRDLSKLDFGKKAFPEMPHGTKSEQWNIENKVRHYCRRAKSCNIELLEVFCDILEVDYNTLLKYEGEPKA